MRSTARQIRANRTITVDFQNEATYFQLLGDGKAFVELVIAFVLSLGFQLKHKATCRGGGGLTRHSHYVRVRLGGLTIWRIQCTTCRAVFTVLPHFVLRYRQMRPNIARDVLLATHGGLSLELCAVIHHLSPMALYRLVCALGQQMCLSRLNHWLPRGQAYPKVVQGTAEFHYQIVDALFPQADAVFDDATALHTAVDVLDPEPTVVQGLVG